jgi:integrase
LILKTRKWRIDRLDTKMKKQQHIVPLSRQAIQILQELLAIPTTSSFLFPALGHPETCLSENTINKALRRMGYTSEDMTAQGFRSMASTLLAEQGWPPDVIERQLAHMEEDEVKAAYNYAQYLPTRRNMMQVWADYLDQLRVVARRQREIGAATSASPCASSLSVWPQEERRPVTSIDVP